MSTNRSWQSGPKALIAPPVDFMARLKAHIVDMVRQQQQLQARHKGELYAGQPRDQKVFDMVPLSFDGHIVVQNIPANELSTTPPTWEKVRLSLTLILYAGVLSAIAGFPTPGLDDRMFPAPLFSSSGKW